MFGRKKSGAKISDRTPVFHVRYIGCTETFVATGRGCSYVPVQRLWDNSPAERNMRKVAVHINSQGLSLRDFSEKQSGAVPQQQQHNEQQQQQHPNHQQQQRHPHQQQHQQHGPYSQDFAIGNISFCNVDRAVNDRIFSWIYRSEGPRRLDCHAVLCSTALKAQTMAIVLSRAFQIAYKDWRAHHRDYGSAATRSSTSTPAPVNTSPSLPETKISNTHPSAAAADTPLPSQPTSSVMSAMTSPADRKEEETSSSMLHHGSPTSSSHKSAHFADDMTSPDYETKAASSVSVQQSTPSSYFMSSSIWDPEMEDLAGAVDCLQADLDLEEDGSH